MLNLIHYHPITGGNGLFSGYFTLSSVWFCKYPLSVFWALPFASAQPRGHGTNAAAMSFRTNVRNLDLSVDSHIPKDDTGATLRFLTFVPKKLSSEERGSCLMQRALVSTCINS